MKILKNIMLFIVGMIILFFIVAIFLPSKYFTERTINIKKPVDIVYSQISDLNNFFDWNPWSRFEPSHEKSVSGTRGLSDQKYEWSGQIIGSGSLTIREVSPNEYVKTDLVFTAPQEIKSGSDWYLEQIPEGTRVKWTYYGDADYPVGRYMGLFIDGMLGPDFEKGLLLLKKRCESSVIIPLDSLSIK